MSATVTFTPIEGWGFSESQDGRLAAPFCVELIDEGVEISDEVKGWKARAIDGKYAGANLMVAPRNEPFSGVVVLSVVDQESAKELFSGFAESNGLEKNWEQR